MQVFRPSRRRRAVAAIVAVGLAMAGLGAVAGVRAADPAPVITAGGFSPIGGPNTGTAQITVTGSNFQNGATLSLTKAGQETINASLTTFVNSTTLKGRFDLIGAAPTFRAIVVKNPDGQTDTEGNPEGAELPPAEPTGFQINGETPKIDSISPSSIERGQTVVATIKGANLARGFAVEIATSASLTDGEPAVSDLVWKALDTVQVKIAVPANAATGARAVSLENADGKTGSCTCLAIIDGPAAGPAVTGATDNSGSAASQGVDTGNVTVSIAGEGFVSGATARLELGDLVLQVANPMVTVNQLGADTLSGTISTAGASPGKYRSRVVNPNGGDGLSPVNSGLYSLLANAPTLSAVAPTALDRGAGKEVALTGTNFYKGATVSVSGGGFVVTNVNVKSNTSITCTIQPTSAAAVGDHDVIVTNTDGQETGAKTIKVNAQDGLWVAGPDGFVFAFGAAQNKGGMQGRALNQPIVGMGATPSGGGYWLVAGDGGVFSFGDAAFHGSTGNLRLNKPIVGLASTPSGKGYWLVAADGGIFRFGDAQFFGSTGNLRLNKPVVGMAATPSGNGYWLVAADGGIFRFGDAPFLGSAGNVRLVQPVTAMASSPDGKGYWLVAQDGGVFAYGAGAPFLGSLPSRGIAGPAYAILTTSSGRGYHVVTTDGRVTAFGDAGGLGNLSGRVTYNRPLVGFGRFPG